MQAIDLVSANTSRASISQPPFLTAACMRVHTYGQSFAAVHANGGTCAERRPTQQLMKYSHCAYTIELESSCHPFVSDANYATTRDQSDGIYISLGD